MLGLLIGGLFAFAFGAVLLMLFFGATRIEEEVKRRAQEPRETRSGAAQAPRFFVVTQPAGPGAGRLDEAVLWKLQQYLDAEQVLADEFVLQPSIESLYRESGRRLTVH